MAPPEHLRISVAIPVLNGEKYLRETLRSIARQSRAPDQIVVSDQGSVDGSLEVVDAFQSDAPCKVVIATTSTEGPTANYLNALSRTTGDLIGFADQDDVWAKERLERVERAFLRRPDVSIVSTDSELVDGHLNRLGTTIRGGRRRSRRLAIKVRRGDDLLLFLRGLPLLAHSITIRAVCKPVALAENRVLPTWWFEGWIASVALSLGRLELIPEALTLYRQHPGQAAGAPSKSFALPDADGKRSFLGIRMQQLAFCRRLLLDDSLDSLLTPHLRAARARTLERNIEFLERRRELLDPRRCRYSIALGLLLDGSYSAFARGPLSFVSDIVSARRHRARR